MEGAAGEIEGALLYQFLWFDEFGGQVLFENFILPDDMREPGFLVDDDVMEEIIDLTLEVLFINLFDLIERDLGPTARGLGALLSICPHRMSFDYLSLEPF